MKTKVALHLLYSEGDEHGGITGNCSGLELIQLLDQMIDAVEARQAHQVVCGLWHGILCPEEGGVTGSAIGEMDDRGNVIMLQ